MWMVRFARQSASPYAAGRCTAAGAIGPGLRQSRELSRQRYRGSVLPPLGRCACQDAQRRAEHERFRRLLNNAPMLLTSIAGICHRAVRRHAVMEGAIIVGMLVAFQTLASMFNAPVASFVGVGAQLQETHGYVERSVTCCASRSIRCSASSARRPAAEVFRPGRGGKRDVRLFADHGAAARRCLAVDQCRARASA